MFERYTEKARRVIFFARYESSLFGSPVIETEHMLLGLMREGRVISSRLGDEAETSIRRQIELHSAPRELIATSVDLALSNQSKQALAYAAEEAERLGQTEAWAGTSSAGDSAGGGVVGGGDAAWVWVGDRGGPVAGGAAG
jgi:ATP-dependent Clp protease ATP-binding subunit ClpA